MDNQGNSYFFKFIIIEIWSSNIQLAFKWIHNYGEKCKNIKVKSIKVKNIKVKSIKVYGEKCKNIKVLRQSTAHAHSQRRIEPGAARRQRSGRSPHRPSHFVASGLVSLRFDGAREPLWVKENKNNSRNISQGFGD